MRGLCAIDDGIFISDGSRMQQSVSKHLATPMLRCVENANMKCFVEMFSLHFASKLVSKRSIVRILKTNISLPLNN